MNVSLDEFISRHKARTESRLAELLTPLNDFDTTLIEAIKYSLLDGGKRIRPLLCYAAAEAVGDISPATNDFAAALECMHVYSLIHDDLPAMDDDALRRGKATSHLAFDEATAILAGDALQSLSFQTIADSSASDKTKVAAIQLLGRCAGCAGMVMGQAIDLKAVNQELTLEQLENMHRHKTGALIEASVGLGALSAGATSEQLDDLRAFALAVGLAFQVHDDILDVISDTETLGKTQGADVHQNKLTFVSLLGLEKAKVRAAQLADEAISHLEPLGERAIHLKKLAQYIVQRDF